MKLTIEIPKQLLLQNETLIIKLNANASPTIELSAVSNPKLSMKTYQETDQIPTLGKYVALLVERLNKLGKQRLAETYTSTLRSFMRYRENKDLALQQLNSIVVADYESFLRQKELKLNTISFYMKRLRAIYNKALETYSMIDARPFAHAFTKTVKTAKRALREEDIRKIASAQPQNQQETLARDLFLFSYYTRGMSFVDIAYLRKTDLRDGHLIYKRKKTGQELQIGWRPCMQAIVDRHASKDGTYLLGILDSKQSKDLRKQYLYKQCRINKALKTFTQRIGFTQTVTMYCARHSWATIAKEKDVPISVISDGMGHHSEKVTHIYLKDTSTEKLDLYNDLLIDVVK